MVPQSGVPDCASCPPTTWSAALSARSTSSAGHEVRNRGVLVTGAAGSIGSELCRVIAGLSPRRLVLLDINESGLFDIAEELRVDGGDRHSRGAGLDRGPRPAAAVFADERPEIVFHSAAYKHVPMLEAIRSRP